jgi:hypothetical protein
MHDAPRAQLVVGGRAPRRPADPLGHAARAAGIVAAVVGTAALVAMASMTVLVLVSALAVLTEARG